MSNAPVTTPLKEFARVSKLRTRIEQFIKRSKSEAGLAQYQVRSWNGWHHHIALSLIATWFLVQETRLKKTDSSDHGPSDPSGDVTITTSTHGLRYSRSTFQDFHALVEAN
jgi:SRSO17 transposase